MSIRTFFPYFTARALISFQSVSYFLLIWVTGLSVLPNCYAQNIEFKPNDGLFQLLEETDVLLDAKYIGWTKGWKWDRPEVEPERSEAGEQFFNLRFPGQGATGQTVLSLDGNSIKYRYSIEFLKALPDTIGSGIEFKIASNAPQRLQAGSEKPYLLPDRDGWGWKIAPDKTILVSFSPGIASIYQDKNNPFKIRAMFFKGQLSPGEQLIDMEVRLFDGVTIADVTKIYGQVETANWIEGALQPENSFIDLSWLNEKPAGLNGFVSTAGERLVFEDGSEARFWGVNIQARTLFINDKDLIRKHARRLARLGVNLARLHHHDSATWVRNSLIKGGENTQKLDDQSLDSYFWWVKCLRDEGIYVWIDLQVLRPWRKGDNIPGWDTDMAGESKNGMSVSKGFIYLNEVMQRLAKQFNELLLTRVNPYTGLALKDDPAVMGMLITNENDITHHFGNTFLADKGHPYHQKLFEDRIDIFSRKYDLPASALNKTWEAGSSKLLLNELEGRFNNEMMNHLRTLGVKVPIATTNLWGRSPIFSLPALTVGDMIDTHAYARENILHKNPRHSANFVHWLGQGQVDGMPMTISEYNIGRREYMNNDGFIPVPYIAAMASFQGWDAIMLYGYSQDRLRGKTLSLWSSYMNPAIVGLIPASALMYREGHISPAKETFAVALDHKTYYNKDVSPRNSTTLRTLPEQHRMVVAMPETAELPWLKPTDIAKIKNVIRDESKDTLPDHQNYILSDTGQIFRDWKKGTLIINSARSQSAIGKIGEEPVKLRDAVLNIKTPNAAVMLTSLDSQDIRRSSKILISTAGRVREVKQGWYTVASEIVSGQIELFSESRNLRIRPLLPSGKKGKAVPVKQKDGRGYIINLPDNAQTHWFLIEGPGAT